MFEDYLVITSAAVTAAFVILAIVLLARYRSMVSSASGSNRLAKNIWDAMEVRLRKQDERIVDIMARVDVYGAKIIQSSLPSQPPSQEKPRPIERRESGPPTATAVAVSDKTRVPRLSTTTERQVLQLLAEGPKGSPDINRLIGKSREHTARLMKSLFEGGYVVRDDSKKPFVYQITDAGRSYLLGTDSG